MEIIKTEQDILNDNPNLLKLQEKNDKLEKQVNNMFNLLSMTSELMQSLELEDVYNSILDILIIQLGSRRHSISLFDNANVLKIVASKFGDDNVDFEYAMLEKGSIKNVLQTKTVYIAKDLTNKDANDIVACIPLIVKDKLIGIIIVHEMLAHKKSFNEDDIELLNLISSQAGYAIVASHSYNEMKKTLSNKDKEITKLYDVSTLVSSALDINEVLNIIINAISDLIVCDIIAIMVYEEESSSLILRNSIGLDPSLIFNYRIKPGEGISGKVFHEKKPVLIKDKDNEVRYIDLVKCEEARLYSKSILSVPIVIKNRVIGVITISKFKGGDYLDVPEKKILTTLAAQISVGIDNALLYEKQEKELVKVSSLFIATNQLHSTININEIYRIANELLVDFIGAKTFFIMLKDQTEDNLSIVLSRGLDKAVADSMIIKIGDGTIGECVKSGNSFILSDRDSPININVSGHNIKLFACIPLKLEDKIAGVIVISELFSQKDDFVKFDKELFDIMAKHTATAILRAQLFATSEQKTSSIYDLSRLLAMSYDLKKSIKTAIELMTNIIKRAKIAVLIYENKKYSILAYEGYKGKELDNIILDDFIKGKYSAPISHDNIDMGLIVAEKETSEPFLQKELEMLETGTALIAQFIYHDKSFNISKNLAVMLSKEKAQSNAIVKGVADGLIVTDIENRIMLVNPTIETLFDFKEKDAIGNNVNKVIINNKITEIINNTLNKGYTEDRVEVTTKDMSVTVNIKSSIVANERDEKLGVVTIMHDITKEIEADKLKDEFLKNLHKISITDGLTGLYNRRYFDKRIDEEFARCRRYHSDFSFLILDIDHFKKTNDTYGHKAGDAILQGVSDIIKTDIRNNIDLAARYGGEEFVIILPETTNENSCLVAERLRKKIEDAKFLFEDKNLAVTISIGLASYPCEGINNSDELVKLADKYLYKAKESGRNRTVYK